MLYMDTRTIVFHNVCPHQVAEFATNVLQNACCEAKRATFERILALALYRSAKGHEIMEIDGTLAVDFTNWLIGGY